MKEKSEGKNAPLATSTRSSVRAAFEHWRATGPAAGDWGLAWFLGNEFCERYYSSHGIAPHAFNHDGSGYYGIQLTPLPCAVNGPAMNALGRLTISGNVENWRSGSPGDHDLETVAMCDAGSPTGEIIAAAIAHMAISPLPAKSHARCRHKRHGASYELLFRISTVLALQRKHSVTNDPDVARWHQVDKKLVMDPGVFYFVGRNEIAVSGDGTILGADDNLWLRYMRGESLETLVEYVERLMGTDEDGPH